MAEAPGEAVEVGDISTGDVDIGIAVGLDRERGGVLRVSNAESPLESRVAFESIDEIEVCLLKPDFCGRDGPFEKGFVGVEGRTERPISRGLVDWVSP